MTQSKSKPVEIFFSTPQQIADEMLAEYRPRKSATKWRVRCSSSCTPIGGSVICH